MDAGLDALFDGDGVDCSFCQSAHSNLHCELDRRYHSNYAAIIRISESRNDVWWVSKKPSVQEGEAVRTVVRLVVGSMRGGMQMEY